MPQQRIPLVGNFTTRGAKKSTEFTTSDQLFTNCTFKVVQNPVTGGSMVAVDRRPGFAGTIGPISNLSSVKRVFVWENLSSAQVVYSGISSASSVTRIIGSGIIYTHADDSDVTYFSQTLDSASTPSLVWQRVNGEAWIYPNGGAASQISAIPSGNVGPIVYLDGFAFVAVAAGATIRNSALNDPTSWPSTGSITAQESPDRLVSLARYNQYIVACGQGSIEFFVNAGNAAGSPLQRVKEMYQPFGVYSADTITQGMGKLFMLTKGTDTPGSIIAYSKGGIERLSTPTVEAMINGLSFGISRLSFFKVNGGHYLAAIYANLSSICSAFVYNFETKLWSLWTTGTNDLNWREVFQSVVISAEYRVFTVAQSSAYVYLIDTYSDNVKYYDGLAASPIAIERTIRTQPIDFGTTKRKTETELVLVGDKASSTHNIAVSVSDDDYGTYSTARNVDMSSIRPRLVRNGSFRKRAYRLVDSNQSRSRLEALEVNVEVSAT